VAVSTASAWNSASALAVLAIEGAIEFASKFPVIANLVNVKDVNGGLVSRFRRWPTLSAGAITEGTDTTPTTVTPTAAALTPSQVGIDMEITDLLSAAGGPPLAAFARQGVLAVMEKLEDDLAALFGALNGGTSIGTSGSDLVFANCLDAIVTLKAAQAPPDMAFVLHPQQFRDYWASVGNTSTAASFVGQGVTNVDGWAAGSRGNGFVTNIAGIPSYESARCPLVNTNADRGGALLNRDAISVSRMWAAKVEQERNPRGVSNVLVITSAYGVGETADNFGVPVETDA
jgi:hypothetical protein